MRFVKLDSRGVHAAPHGVPLDFVISFTSTFQKAFGKKAGIPMGSLICCTHPMDCARIEPSPHEGLRQAGFIVVSPGTATTFEWDDGDSYVLYLSRSGESYTTGGIGRPHPYSDERMGVLPAVERWYLSGEVGSSSMAIAMHALGLVPQGSWTYENKSTPSDAWDFRSCRLLLESVPGARDQLPAMIAVSDSWRDLVEHWEGLCQTMDAELPQWRDPPSEARPDKTYRKLKELQDIGRARGSQVEAMEGQSL